MALVSSIPHISVSLAPPDEPATEPYSPFSHLRFSSNDLDGFRPQHLTPPPSHTTFKTQPSPLRLSDTSVTGGGLQQEQFDALLRASKERNAPGNMWGAKKALDLRKEVALKAHKNKQEQRRALFLSKIMAPPSPNSTAIPKTPPESPAIFHYTLPSPGLVSPLSLFDSVDGSNYRDSLAITCQPWVEQVHFRLPDTKLEGKQAEMCSGQSLPSLDQISARLLSRIPGLEPPQPHKVLLSEVTPRSRPPLNVGRLKMPSRASTTQKSSHMPVSPSPVLPEIQVTTLFVSQVSHASATQLSESNLRAFNSRENRSHTMLTTLRRRTLSSQFVLDVLDTSDKGGSTKWKRQSAPAELLAAQKRSGFDHSILSFPGGF